MKTILKINEDKEDIDITEIQTIKLSNKKLKPFIRKRDNYLCCFCNKDVREVAICGEYGQQSVHHKIPLSLKGGNTPENCITICGECHQKLEILIMPLKLMLKRDFKTLNQVFTKKLKDKGFVIIKKDILEKFKEILSKTKRELKDIKLEKCNYGN